MKALPCGQSLIQQLLGLVETIPEYADIPQTKPAAGQFRLKVLVLRLVARQSFPDIQSFAVCFLRFGQLIAEPIEPAEIMPRPGEVTLSGGRTRIVAGQTCEDL